VTGCGGRSECRGRRQAGRWCVQAPRKLPGGRANTGTPPKKSLAVRRRLSNRSGPKQELKKARAVLKQAVRKAKSEWIVDVVAGVNS
jgi:hypothetical protein